MVPCKSTAEEVSFEWSHHRILFTDSKVRTTLHVSIIESGNERVKLNCALLSEVNSQMYLFTVYLYCAIFSKLTAQTRGTTTRSTWRLISKSFKAS